jgi:hypothetical protein
LASLVKKIVVNPFWQLTRLLEIIEPSINHVPVLDGSYKLPNGRRALPFEMVEVPKETGRDDSQRTLGSTYEPHLVGCSKRTPSPLTILAKMAKMPS